MYDWLSTGIDSYMGRLQMRRAWVLVARSLGCCFELGCEMCDVESGAKAMEPKPTQHDNALDMYEALQPHKIQETFGIAPNGKARDFLFRGLSEDWHPLVPASWRNPNIVLESMAKEHSITPKVVERCGCEQAKVERELLHTAFQYADVAGVNMPGDGFGLRKAFASTDDFTGQLHSDPGLQEFVATVQHNRLPTRLMDWSRRPNVAMWFAADTAAREYLKAKNDTSKDVSNNRFAVWVLQYRAKNEGLDQDSAYREYGAAVFSVGRGRNDNLHKQSGVFSVHRFETMDKRGDNGNVKVIRPLDDILEGTPFTMQKHTLPWNQAADLLNLLADNFVQGATVYAGWEGVRSSVDLWPARKVK